MASNIYQVIRTRRAVGIAIGLLAVALIVVAIKSRGAPAEENSELSAFATMLVPSPTPLVTPTLDPTEVAAVDFFVPPEDLPGTPAIQPSGDAAVPGAPRVTKEGAAAYLQDTYADAEIVSIEYLSADEYETLRNFSRGQYGGRLLLVAKLRGAFDIIGLPPSVRKELEEKYGKPLMASHLELVFDADTGNHLSTAYPPN
jgi:hypothetical protein